MRLERIYSAKYLLKYVVFFKKIIGTFVLYPYKSEDGMLAMINRLIVVES